MHTTARLTSDGEVSEEEPAGDQWLFGVARRLHHDVQVRGVEAQCCSRQTVCYQIHPEQLHRD